MRSSNSNSGVSSTGSNTSSKRSNDPALLQLYSFGSQKLDQIASHFTPQINPNTSDQSQYFIPSPMSSPTLQSSFEMIETHPGHFDNPKSKSTHLPLPKLLSKSTSKMKKALQGFQIKNQTSEKPSYPSFHSILTKTYSTVPQLKNSHPESCTDDLNINEGNQPHEVQKPIRKKGLIKFDQTEFIEQRLEAKENLALDDELRQFQLSVNQIQRQRAKSEHKQSIKKNEFRNQTNTSRSSYEAPAKSYLEANSFQHLQNHLQRSEGSEPPRIGIFQPLSPDTRTENPQVLVSHHHNLEKTDHNTHEDNEGEDEDDGGEDELSLYEVTPEQYEITEQLVLPQWPNNL